MPTTTVMLQLTQLTELTRKPAFRGRSSVDPLRDLRRPSQLKRNRPRLAVEYKQIALVLHAFVLLTVHILQTKETPIMHDALLVPETLSKWRILLVDVFD